MPYTNIIKQSSHLSLRKLNNYKVVELIDRMIDALRRCAILVEEVYIDHILWALLRLYTFNLKERAHV